jgi:anaerobic sulfite reductase subunit B
MRENPMMPTPHKVIQIDPETDLESTFRIEVDSPPAWGQFYMVSIPRIGEMPISVSGIGTGWIDMTIRKVGKVSQAVHSLNENATLFLRGPYGNGFPMEEFKGQHLAVVAGGSGIAPVRPLVDYYYQHPDEVDKLDLLFGFKTPDDILFTQDIERWKGRFDTILTVDDACGIWEGECVGLVTEYVKNIKLSEPDKMDIVIVGPPVMIKFTAAEFVRLGVPEERIIVSMERRMSCGFGKCGHCKIGEYYVCLDGPVFRYNDAVKLVD